ncbi:hypothetical protein GLAREA_08724 [Glarea lozoyensis ATCC 20868]|uniref:Uncharacterized protein n=2 Tax=Glarea lozoyensis TaxID=101852 RepID=S3DX73_GLAL2|nr:uncharacterized protein GLAREA_08724 [Glarea lozoyensis ATCC 20868]EHK99317.1 hypothetical protein M7I_4834 [Glarea lozoyensis 74030]EPE36561.1 hypothetical protein GLAREA_08724 [Glarea lozoyensis ATCC 20868]
MSQFAKTKSLTKALGLPFYDEDDSLLLKHLDTINGRGEAPPDPPPDPTAMGDNDVKNVLYINFNPNFDDPVIEADIKAKNKVLQLNTNWLSLRAGVETAKNIKDGKLPGDMSVASQMKRSAYRAKVIDYIMLKSSWMGGFKTQGVERTYSVKKAEFHTELLTTFLEGMGLQPTVYGALEGVLKMISDSIFSAENTTEKSMFYLLSTVYTWDEITKDVQPTVRTFYFEATSEVKKYVAGKATINTVNLKIGFMQNDSIFNLDVWDSGVGTEIKKYLVAEGVKIVNEPIDIPVDP